MSIDWGDWQPFEGAPGRPLRDVDRRTALGYFDELMRARERRVEALERLVGRNGFHIGFDDEGLQNLNIWYRDHVEGPGPERLFDRWYAVGLDVGLYLGEAIIRRAPTVQWRLSTAGKRDASYQRPVLMGFTKVPNSKYNVDPERLVGIHGHRIVAGYDEPHDLFVSIVQSASEKA